jgi:hypothetical protein
LWICVVHVHSPPTFQPELNPGEYSTWKLNVVLPVSLHETKAMRTKVKSLKVKRSLGLSDNTFLKEEKGIKSISIYKKEFCKELKL